MTDICCYKYLPLVSPQMTYCADLALYRLQFEPSNIMQCSHHFFYTLFIQLWTNYYPVTNEHLLLNNIHPYIKHSVCIRKLQWRYKEYTVYTMWHNPYKNTSKHHPKDKLLANCNATMLVHLRICLEKFTYPPNYSQCMITIHLSNGYTVSKKCCWLNIITSTPLLKGLDLRHSYQGGWLTGAILAGCPSCCHQ